MVLISKGTKLRCPETLITMTKETVMKLFNEKQIHTQGDDEQGRWYFSIVDVADRLFQSIDLQFLVEN